MLALARVVASMGPCSADDVKAGDVVAVAIPLNLPLGEGGDASAFALLGRVIDAGAEVDGKGELLQDASIMQAGLQVIFTGAVGVQEGVLVALHDASVTNYSKALGRSVLRGDHTHIRLKEPRGFYRLVPSMAKLQSKHEQLIRDMGGVLTVLKGGKEHIAARLLCPRKGQLAGQDVSEEDSEDSYVCEEDLDADAEQEQKDLVDYMSSTVQDGYEPGLGSNSTDAYVKPTDELWKAVKAFTDKAKGWAEPTKPENDKLARNEKIRELAKILVHPDTGQPLLVAPEGSSDVLVYARTEHLGLFFYMLAQNKDGITDRFAAARRAVCNEGVDELCGLLREVRAMRKADGSNSIDSLQSCNELAKRVELALDAGRVGWANWRREKSKQPRMHISPKSPVPVPWLLQSLCNRGDSTLVWCGAHSYQATEGHPRGRLRRLRAGREWH